MQLLKIVFQIIGNLGGSLCSKCMEIHEISKYLIMVVCTYA